jgi:hypothetical protein
VLCRCEHAKRDADLDGRRVDFDLDRRSYLRHGIMGSGHGQRFADHQFVLTRWDNLFDDALHARRQYHHGGRHGEVYHHAFFVGTDSQLAGVPMRKRKALFTLNVDGYSPEITRLTFPLLRYYARKIGAEFIVIDKRKFPDWPVTMEKLQIYELAKSLRTEWNVYFDADALVHPETPDWTSFLPKDTVAHNGIDMAAVRWRYDKYFMRDGRNIGSCNWCTIASEWCADLWRPPDDISLEEALDEIYPTVEETNTVVTREHLIDDYFLSRNIARFGLKTTTLMGLQKRINLPDGNFLFHQYLLTPSEKVVELKKVLDQWKVPDSIMKG